MPPAKKVDPATGEIIVPVYDSAEIALRTRPDFSKAKTVESVVGKRPPLYNLRDNPSFHGRAFTIVKVREAEGEFGYHLYLAGWLSASAKPDDNPQAVVIRTGSEFVLGRVVPAISTINAGQPLYGVFENAGQAWLFN